MENNNLAYICENETLDRENLNRKSDGLANYLCNKNVSRILIYGHKNQYMIISILACLKARITYIICDITLPKSRIYSIANNSNADLALCTENELLDNIECVSCTELEQITSKNYNIIEYKNKLNDIAYIVFTSGSTGEPKGIEITYDNLENFINWFSNIELIRNINPKVILNQALFSFDLSVIDVFYSFYNKSTLYCLTKNIIEDFSLLFYHIKKSNAEMLVFTPSFIELCLCDKQFDENLMSNLKIIFLCGEVLKPTVAKKLIERFKNTKIINAYGPSEATCCVTAIEITKKMTELNMLPIGKLDNSAVEVKIYNQNGFEVNDNGIGEIVLIGKSVAKGYCNYKNDAFKKINNKLFYFTGDIGHISNNKLYFDGRADNQIKYKGYRIDINDIENNIYKIKGIKQVSITAKRDSNNEVLGLVAYVVCDNDIDISYINDNLKSLLPHYMIPKSINIVDKISLDFNKKINNNIR